jgi:transcriptional regulator with XRE-family HTH domain
MDQSKDSPFGAYLKGIREQRGWPLDQLAQRFGSDRANIHRIESGRARPRFETIERLVQALGASPHEAMELFERAGYQPPIWPTTAVDFDSVHEALDAEWLNDEPPATIVTDVYWTVWHVNRAFAQLFTSREPAHLAGLHYLTLCLDPAYGFQQALRRIASEDDVAAFLLVVMARFRRRLLGRQGAIKSTDDLERLKRLPGFMALWERANPGRSVPGDHLSGLIRLPVRAGGCLVVESASVVRDRRFLFSHYLPTDEATAALLGALLILRDGGSDA